MPGDGPGYDHAHAEADRRAVTEAKRANRIYEGLRAIQNGPGFSVHSQSGSQTTLERMLQERLEEAYALVRALPRG